LDEENINIDDKKLLALIEQLKSEGRIKLSVKVPDSFKEYLADIWNTWWFYLAIIVALSELFFVISDAQAGIAMFLRILFGLGMLGIIQGFLTVLIIFSGRHVNVLEYLSLSILLSVILFIIILLMLYMSISILSINNI